MIHLDTSALVAAITTTGAASARFLELIREGRRLRISSPVAYEWLRGPRTGAHLDMQELFFPPSEIVPFGFEEALSAAGLYRQLARPRARETDIAIAACAITRDATLWTLNPDDFEDIPGLKLLQR